MKKQAYNVLIYFVTGETANEREVLQGCEPGNQATSTRCQTIQVHNIQE